ncbi:MAG: DUF3108 domain-containing protein [Kofleriaceae bacterium]
MLRASLVAVLCCAASCGAPAAGVTTPGTLPAPDPTAPIVAPPIEVVARPGEQMIYRISLHGIDVAEFTVTVGAAVDLNGTTTIPVQTHAVSSPLLTLFHKVDDTLASWIDLETGRPVKFTAHEMASAKSDAVEDTQVWFAPGAFKVEVMRDGERLDEEQVVLHDAYDIPSVLTFVRGWDADVGARATLDIMRSRTAWRADFTVGGHETTTTVLGDLAAVRVDGSGVRLRRDGSEDPASDRRKFSIWVSDDADRVPLRLVAHTDYGDIRMDLAAYSAE